MDKLKQVLKTILDKMNFLDHQEKLSLTNVCVFIFIAITAFRSLFGGSTFHIGTFNWVVQVIDYGDTLPLLYGLLNYSHKRSETNKMITSDSGGKEIK